MRIKRILSQHRRDLHILYQCEHCSHEREGSGYDDDNFHENVIPKMTCKECGKVASKDYEPSPTKYAAHQVI